MLSMLHPGRLVGHSRWGGGAGKTRLAIEVAKRSRAHSGAIEDCEVYWVPLAVVADPTEVPRAVATESASPVRSVIDHWLRTAWLAACH